MSSNVTKIHFSNLCKIQMDRYSKYMDDEIAKLEIFKQLVNLNAIVWNACSTSKNFQEAEQLVRSCLNNEVATMSDDLISDMVKNKIKNYKYDKNLILYAKIEKQDGDYKVYSYFIDEKEYDCPAAQAIYDKINSASFQIQIARLSSEEKNQAICELILQRLSPKNQYYDDYILENEDNPLDKVRVYLSPDGSGKSYKSFSLREIKNVYEASKKEVDAQFKKHLSSCFKFKSYDRENLNNFEDYFRMLYVLMTLGHKYSLDEKDKNELGKKASYDALSLYNASQNEEKFYQALFTEPEYELLNFVYSYVSKYKDKDPYYFDNFIYIFWVAMLSYFRKAKSIGFELE
jgi:hypothetical protein